MIFDLGPFELYRSERTGSLNITLRRIKNWGCGWAYGWRDTARGEEKPLVSFRIGKLVVLYIEACDKGYELWFLGFWAFPHWGKRKK